MPFCVLKSFILDIKKEATMLTNITNKFFLISCLFLFFSISTVFAQPDPGYYSSVDSSNPAALKSSLHNIIQESLTLHLQQTLGMFWN